MKQLFTITAVVFFGCCGFSQNLSGVNWVFGDSCGLNFSSGAPEFFETGVSSFEAVASVSDTEGNLLFYTNGQAVWNKEHEVMPYGYGLQIGKCPDTLWGSSITQGVIIIPKPLSNNIFYVFYEESYWLSYAMIDMSLNGGLGDVMEKNVQLIEVEITEKIQAVKHANGRDWWLALRVFPDFDAGETAYSFVSFLLTPEGISGPYIQIYGDEYDADNGPGVGQMKFTKEGDLLALTRGKHIDLYDFDRCTGEFFNFYTIYDVTEFYTYGLEFSGDGNKLYVNTQGPSNKQTVVQYCLNCDTPIPDTKQIIYENTYGDYWLAQFQLAFNDKIYMSTAYLDQGNTVWSPVNTYLSVINNPNELGVACDFDTLTIDLQGKRDLASLPNMPNYNLGALTGSGCDTITAIQNFPLTESAIDIYPNPANSFINISSQLTNFENANAAIYSLAGVKVKEINLNRPSQKMDVADVQQGLYTLVISNGDEYLYRDKLVILK